MLFCVFVIIVFGLMLRGSVVMVSPLLRVLVVRFLSRVGHSVFALSFFGLSCMTHPLSLFWLRLVACSRFSRGEKIERLMSS